MATDPPRPAARLREALPTTAAARACFDEVVRLLGDRAFVQTGGEGRSRALFVKARAGDAALVPWPLLTFVLADPATLDAAEMPSEGLVEGFREVSGGFFSFGAFHPVPGQFQIHDGPLALGVEFDRAGHRTCSTEPAEREAFADLGAALAGPAEGRSARLAHHLASLDLGRHGPARVLYPHPVPSGIEGVWNVGRHALRAALAARRTPPGSFWAVADGLVGRALAFGASREEALDAWRREVERVRPTLPPPANPSAEPLPPPYEVPDPEAPFDPSEPAEAEIHRIQFVGRGWDAPPPDPSPEAVPAVVVRVAPLPAAPPPRGTWTRWLGEHGATHFAVRWADARGATYVGEALLRLVDLETLDRHLDELDDANPFMSRGEGRPGPRVQPPPTHATVYYRCVDAGTGLPVEPRIELSQLGPGFPADFFDGRTLRTHVVRVRTLESS